MSIDISRYIRYVTMLHGELGARPTRIQLVKYLYLMDLYFARENKKTLTGWTWKFHNYGPWTIESLKAIEVTRTSGLIHADSFASKYSDEDFSLYSANRDLQSSLDQEEIERSMPLLIVTAIKKAVSLHVSNTASLLHYVYFETEPMIDARPDDILDFSIARWPQKINIVPYAPKVISKSKLKKAREALKKLGSSAASFKLPDPIYDTEYEKAIAILNNNELSHTELFRDTASIKKIIGNR